MCARLLFISGGRALEGLGLPIPAVVRQGEDNVMTIMPAPDAQRDSAQFLPVADHGTLQASVLALTRAADEAAWSDSPGPGAVVGVGLRVAGVWLRPSHGPW